VFPLPFKSLRTMSGGKEGSYVIGAMFTAAYSAKAERLAASCDKFELPYFIHEVPEVHKSISVKGTEDFSYTKPNFIRHMLATHRKPVLYVDADCEFMSRPDLIGELSRSDCDFAIYNWCADEYKDVFVPVEVDTDAEVPSTENRFYRFVGGFDWFSNNQLICSGLVQFYGDSIAAQNLLSRWQRTLVTFPGCLDDEALAFTFNNLTRYSWLWWLLRVQWLPKSYARISWWIYVKPVINHSEIPGKPARVEKINDPRGRKTFYRSQLEHRSVTCLLPRHCIIDTVQHMVCKLVDGQLVQIEPTDQEFWL
jgi:hypothetical protein